MFIKVGFEVCFVDSSCFSTFHTERKVFLFFCVKEGGYSLGVLEPFLIQTKQKNESFNVCGVFQKATNIMSESSYFIARDE